MQELQRLTEIIGAHVATSRKGYREALEVFNEAEQLYRKAVETRELILQTMLNEQGLAICSGLHDTENIEDPTAEQLGIYQRSSMRLHIYQLGPYEVQGEYEDSVGLTKTVGLYCPDHFPQNQHEIFDQRDGFTHIESEILLRDGKFVLAVNGADITRMVNKGGIGIETNGKLFPDQAIYRYFGIPDLPQKPDLNNVKYGT
jgi:hypothetical protein